MGELNRISVGIRLGEISDLELLAAMEQRIFGYDLITRRQMKYLLQSPCARVVIAEENGDMLGYSVLLTRKGSSVIRLYSLGVLPEARHRGIARMLLAYVECYAGKTGRSSIHLEVHAGNMAGILLYLAEGYSLTRRKEQYYTDGAPALCMEKSMQKICAAGTFDDSSAFGSQIYQ